MGISGNEIVDQMANDSVASGSLINYLPPVADLKTLIKPKLLSIWERQWQDKSQTKGRYLFRIQPKILPKPWFRQLPLSRFEIVTLCRLRTGHNSLPAHLSRIKV